MDNSSNNNHCSNENFLYAEELKSSSSSPQQQAKLITPHRQRSMSLLYCINKRLRRRVQHEQVCYNSQDDLPSSSTDSFSLSLDCGASSEKHDRSCSTDLSSEEHLSSASSSSGNSRMSSSGNDENDLDGRSNFRPEREQRHSYSHSCYRSVSEMSDSDNDNIEEVDNNPHANVAAEAKNNSSYKFSARSPLKGLHLNRISMSSVSRVLQNISSSSSSSTSIRSLSCNSTPLKSSKNEQQKNKKAATSNKTESKKAAAKPQPQQQRILRQPINYVYLKGMSGLPTRRVPRSSLCCSYACR